MPELPEVETIVRGLKSVLIGLEISNINISVPKIFSGDISEAINSPIAEITRKGKIILIRFRNKKTLAIHLKMTGQLIWVDQKSNPSKGLIGGHPDTAYKELPPHKYTHVILTFSNNSVLYFNDLRKFGWMQIISSENESDISGHLGPDALGVFDRKAIIAKYRRRGNSPIKSALLDQTILAGIGNIYADESLFCAKINPLRLIKDVSDNEFEKLLICIPDVLQESIKRGGTSTSDYVKIDGSKGKYFEVARVYGREGKPCRVCGTPIKRIKIGQRSSHFCPQCQV